ncbi:MAG TPA: anti-sigma factor [Terriglobales bacterium]|nr:anti-sigma factor [Terriglobales bacterium]
MNCELNATALHGYFDGELDAVRAAEFEKHVASCATCQASLNTMKSLRDGLKNADLYQGASVRMRTRIAEELGSETRPSTTKWKWFFVPAFSLAILLVAGGVAFVTQHRASSTRLQAELIDAHVRSLQPGHLMDVQSTDQHTVKPWFDGKLDFIPPVGDFSPQGFPLLGGRLDVVEGHNVAALVYGRRKHLINLFVWPEGGQPAVAGEGARQGYNWLSWRAGDMQFCLVSDVSSTDLRELQDLIRR